MPPDPELVAETMAWLSRAADDLRAGTLLRRAAVLSDYAWKFRYPSEAATPSLGEADGALAMARQDLDAITARLPAEVRP